MVRDVTKLGLFILSLSIVIIEAKRPLISELTSEEIFTILHRNDPHYELKTPPPRPHSHLPDIEPHEHIQRRKIGIVEHQLPLASNRQRIENYDRPQTTDRFEAQTLKTRKPLKRVFISSSSHRLSRIPSSRTYSALHGDNFREEVVGTGAENFGTEPTITERITMPATTPMAPVKSMTRSSQHVLTEADIDLVAVCEQVKRISQTYRIRDMPKFARNNCVLIRMYYPKAACEDIWIIVDYCFPQEAAQFAH
ncbi:unnamed protein product [Anisakis simplex]|uniref:Spaetzle domain-containing protein n=1 Tax=Anisakis simplex TaxID=6269 RepID=A0A0M3J025_ANISI|nr:unnamed protein product [Anisakis simplex]